MFHKIKLEALAIAAPKIPNSGINIIFNIILIKADRIIMFLKIFSFPVIIKIYPTEPHIILKNCPNNKIHNETLAFLNSSPKKPRKISEFTKITAIIGQDNQKINFDENFTVEINSSILFEKNNFEYLGADILFIENNIMLDAIDILRATLYIPIFAVDS